jgi:cation diffusion facilitator family transporter
MHDAHIHRYFEVHGAHRVDVVSSRERRTWAVVALTAAMMVAELVVGSWTGSLALLADGVHMATHVGAIGLTAVAYGLARRWARHEAFTFGTGKVYSLAGYTSALALAAAAAWMCVEAVLRMVSPEAIHFGEALPVAVLGLVVNLASAKLLHAGHDYGHAEKDSARRHAHDHDAHDHAPTSQAHTTTIQTFAPRICTSSPTP